MRDWLDLFGFFTCGAMLLLTLLGLGVAVIMPGMDRWNKRFFMFFFAVLVLYMAASAFPLVAWGMALSATSMFVIVTLEHIEQYVHLQQETVRQHAGDSVARGRRNCGKGDGTAAGIALRRLRDGAYGIRRRIFLGTRKPKFSMMSS